MALLEMAVLELCLSANPKDVKLCDSSTLAQFTRVLPEGKIDA